MKRELFDKWVEALESGRFIQGTGALKKRADNGEVRHCCLGVLCDIAELKGRETAYGHFSYEDCDSRAGGFLPLGFAREQGMESNGVPIGGRGCGMISLSALNDSGRTFEQIAEYLRKHRSAYTR